LIEIGLLVLEIFFFQYKHIDLDYGSYRLSNVEIGLTAGVTGQQGMLTPP
jgi:hypothetical protein